MDNHRSSRADRRVEGFCRKQRIVVVLYGILAAAWTGMIFSFSSQDGSESGALSSEITHAFLNMLTTVGLASACNVTPEQFLRIEGIIRTCAHFTEFAVLGGLVGRLSLWIPCRSIVSKAGRIARWSAPVVLCLLIATTDELLQLGSPGRAFQITDILIDLAGSTTGYLIVSSIHLPQWASPVR